MSPRAQVLRVYLYILCFLPDYIAERFVLETRFEIDFEGLQDSCEAWSTSSGGHWDIKGRKYRVFFEVLS